MGWYRWHSWQQGSRLLSLIVLPSAYKGLASWFRVAACAPVFLSASQPAGHFPDMAYNVLKPHWPELRHVNISTGEPLGSSFVSDGHVPSLKSRVLIQRK